MRRFVVVGQRASGSAALRLDDLPSSSGRLDVLLRCLRAALLTSHGVRADTVVYLVLAGEPSRVRALRVEGARVRFLRPDERSLALLVQKSLACEGGRDAFVEVRPGVSLAEGGLEVVARELEGATLVSLDEDADDVRGAPLGGELAVFVGDHLGFSAKLRAWLGARGARAVSLGPTSLFAEDAIVLLANELDRRAASGDDEV